RHNIEDVLKKRVAARLERQELLTQADGPQAFFIIDEAALWRRIGSESGEPTLMVAQLEHLKQLAADHSNIHIQFIPFSIGLYRGLHGPFVLLEFEDPNDTGLLYMENRDGQVLVREDPDQTAPYVDEFGHLEEIATPNERLSEYIDVLLRQYRQGL